MRPTQRLAHHPLAILTILWVLAAVLVNPVGDFPLNDDFSFGRSVFNLTEQGVFQLDEWLSMTLVAQLLWGAGWCKIFGFSFTVLRFSTLVAGLIGLVGCYQLVRDAGHTSRTALLAVLCIGASPLFFSLSFTFMTDVPFFTCLVLGTLFFSRALRQGGWRWVALGTAFALAAVFIRQLGLMLPAAFAVAIFFQKNRSLRSVTIGTLPLLLAIAAYAGYVHWLSSAQGLPETFGNPSGLTKRLDDADFWPMNWQRFGILLTYFGLWFLPLSLWLSPNLKPLLHNGLAKKTITLACLASALFCCWHAWPRLPWGNILFNLGLGPKVLKDGQFFMNVAPILPAWGKGIFKVIGMAGGVLLLLHVLRGFFEKMKGPSSREINLPKKKGKGEFKLGDESPYYERAVSIFVLANLLIYGGYLLLDLYFFDRYFFQLMPFVLLLMLPSAKQADQLAPVPVQGLAFAALLGIATFSITATHDYLAWNRARWQALDHLTETMNVTPDRIDGGFEFNGWHRVVPERTYGDGRSWWWVKSDEFAVTFGGMEGYEKVERFPWARWLPPGRDSVFILEKK